MAQALVEVKISFDGLIHAKAIYNKYKGIDFNKHIDDWIKEQEKENA